MRAGGANDTELVTTQFKSCLRNQRKHSLSGGCISFVYVISEPATSKNRGPQKDKQTFWGKEEQRRE